MGLRVGTSLVMGLRTGTSLLGRGASLHTPGIAVPQSLSNAQKLALAGNTAVGTQVRVTDGFVVSGDISLSATDLPQIGFYAPAGSTYNSKPVFTIPTVANWIWFRSGTTTWVSSDGDPNIDEGDLGSLSSGIGDTGNPWDSTGWEDSTSHNAATLTHPAVQQLTISDPSNEAHWSVVS